MNSGDDFCSLAMDDLSGDGFLQSLYRSVVVSLRERKLHLAERDGYSSTFPNTKSGNSTAPIAAHPFRCAKSWAAPVKRRLIITAQDSQRWRSRAASACWIVALLTF